MMNNISIISNYYENIIINYNNNTIYIGEEDEYILLINLQMDNLYFYFNPNYKPTLHLHINISNNTKSIYYILSLSNLNKNMISLNFYYIYIIKKYYLNQIKCYSFGIYSKKELYKQFNTMKLNKIVAIII